MTTPRSNTQSTFQPRRPLGRTGFVATALGIGDLADRNVPLEACVATLHAAMDHGLNVIDTAPGYEGGYSEEVVGAALRGRRDGMFVIDKVDFPDQPVTPQVDGSLQRLGLDHTDLFVFHGLSDLELWQRVAAPDGAMDDLARCVQAGKTRFRGISSHNPDVLDAALRSGLCDVVMFPIGPCVHPRYVTEILPLARKLNVGTVCFKTFGAGKLLGDTLGYGRPLQVRPRGKLSSGGDTLAAAGAVLPRLPVDACVHYTLTRDPDVALLGMSFANELEAAIAAARSFTPLTEAALAKIEAEALAAVAEKGPLHWNPVPAQAGTGRSGAAITTTTSRSSNHPR